MINSDGTCNKKKRISEQKAIAAQKAEYFREGYVVFEIVGGLGDGCIGIEAMRWFNESMPHKLIAYFDKDGIEKIRQTHEDKVDFLEDQIKDATRSYEKINLKFRAEQRQVQKTELRLRQCLSEVAELKEDLEMLKKEGK